MTNFIVQSVGFWGNNECRADIECNSLEEFITYPVNLMIEGNQFRKDCFHMQNKCAYYIRQVNVVISNKENCGEFEIINVKNVDIDQVIVERTNITVK